MRGSARATPGVVGTQLSPRNLPDIGLDTWVGCKPLEEEGAEEITSNESISKLYHLVGYMASADQPGKVAGIFKKAYYGKIAL